MDAKFGYNRRIEKTTTTRKTTKKPVCVKYRVLHRHRQAEQEQTKPFEITISEQAELPEVQKNDMEVEEKRSPEKH
uniref:Uncharacterized protein n=1 Tax=Romanomermis culicivorax TaxID=13658 RepID=A0A915J4R5_ROMCU